MYFKIHRQVPFVQCFVFLFRICQFRPFLFVHKNWSFAYNDSKSFMETLYWLKRDLKENGDASRLMKQFTAVCAKMERADSKNSYSAQRPETVGRRIDVLNINLGQVL